MADKKEYLTLPFNFDVFKRRMGEVALKCGQVVEVLSMGKPTVSEVDLARSLLEEIKGTIEDISKDLKESLPGYIK